MQLSKVLFLALAAVAIASDDSADKKKHHKHHGVGCEFAGTPPLCLITACPAGKKQCGQGRKCAGSVCCTTGKQLRCCDKCPTKRELAAEEAEEMEMEEE